MVLNERGISDLSDKRKLLLKKKGVASSQK